MPKPSQSDRDEPFMRRAMRLAERGRGSVEPNPMVGCVLVRGGRIISEGYHRRFGGPHAEVDALRRCEGSPRGATAYVTLEPCCYTGKTPPCTEALVAAGVKRVVAAMRDPNPRVTGKGFRRLRAAGIEVTEGVLEAELQRLNAPFVKLMTQKRPWVILKWAQGLDGKIATHAGDSKWISDETCRAHAHRVRGRMDAILIGANTATRDDPMLTARVGRPKRIATRIVLDARLRTPPKSQLVRTAHETPTWFLCGRGAPSARERVLKKAGCVVRRLEARDGRVSLPAVLDLLGQCQMANVLVEGGGHLLGRFVDERLTDEFHVYIAPLLIGGEKAISALAGVGPATITDALRFDADPTIQRMGSGWFFRALAPMAKAPKRARK